MGVIKCSQCQTEFDDKKKKCPNCGSEVVEEVTFTCGNCGAEVNADATQCPNCKASFVDEQETNESNEEITSPQNKYEKTIHNLGLFKMIYLVAAVIVSFFLIICSIGYTSLYLFIFAVTLVISSLIVCLFVEWASNVLECLYTLTKKK